MYMGPSCPCQNGILRCDECRRYESMRLQAQRIRESGDPTELVPLALQRFFTYQELCAREEQARLIQVIPREK